MANDQHAHYSDLMKTALTYMINGWPDLVKYRKDGRYTIDNSLAERTIRPFTVGRKNSVGFSSPVGAELASIYYTFVETCKLNGLSPKDYFTHVFRQLMTGNKDYTNLLPSNYSGAYLSLRLSSLHSEVIKRRTSLQEFF